MEATGMAGTVTAATTFLDGEMKEDIWGGMRRNEHRDGRSSKEGRWSIKVHRKWRSSCGLLSSRESQVKLLEEECRKCGFIIEEVKIAPSCLNDTSDIFEDQEPPMPL
ncbi:unnamed protein product [Cochlearia groenlandica]